jgi:hypothetical protein
MFCVRRKKGKRKREKEEGCELLLFGEKYSLECNAAATALPTLRLCLIVVGVTLKIDATPQLLARSPVVSEAQILPPFRKFETSLTRRMRL